MTRVMKLGSAALIALTLAVGASIPTPAIGASIPTVQLPPPCLDDWPPCEEDEDKELTRKVNEYEGQHFTPTGDPSQWL